MNSKKLNILNILRSHARLISLAILFLAISSLLSLAIFMYLGDLIERGSYEYVIDHYLTTIIILITLGVTTGLRKYTMELLGEKIRCDVQEKVFNTLMNMTVSDVAKNNSGFYVSILTNVNTTLNPQLFAG